MEHLAVAVLVVGALAIFVTDEVDIRLDGEGADGAGAVDVAGTGVDLPAELDMLVDVSVRR